MDSKQHLEIASQQLDRALGFFARVEAKASFVFAVNSTVLALVAVNIQYGDLSNWLIIVPAVACILLIGASLIYVYKCSFPNLTGGSNSLVYFREIAKRRESEFIDQFSDIDEKAYARDLMGQIWRNAEILSAKFSAIKIAFILTGLSLLPSFLFLLATSIAHPHLPIIK